MSNFMQIVEAQKTMESSVRRMLTEFERKLNNSPAAKVTIASVSEELSVFKEQTLALLKLMGEQINALSKSQDIMEMRHRRKFLLFNGIPEEADENVSAKVSSIVSEHLKIPDVSSPCLRACHRLGKPSEGRCRPILVRFADISLKASVWKKKTAFKGTAFSLAEFLTPQRQALFTEARKAFGMRNCWSLDGNIHVKLRTGKRERIESEDDIIRLKIAQGERPAQSTSTPEQPVEEENATNPSGQPGRSRRVVKPVSLY